jgi:acetylornithine deacetylase/succinyl-diaminopimelate desuccinylase-like protein
MTLNFSAYQDLFKKNEKQFQRFYFDLLKIPSISTGHLHNTDCQKAASFVHAFLKELGFQAEIFEEEKRYLVFAEKIQDPSFPTLMFYGHTDVQPVDPLDLWKTPPFEPTLKEGNVYARGAQDNKGQLAYVLCATKAFIEEKGKLPFNLKFVIEGEEESGSIGTEKILHKIKDRLKADELYIVDFDAKSKTKPSIVLGMRGLAACEIEIENSRVDLHSGMFGGVVYNPIRALCEMISSCYHTDGKLAFNGAYDGLKELSKEDLESIDFSFSEKDLFDATGAKALCVPKGIKPREANWLYPTLEINGLGGGYLEDGVKTVLPSKAFAKISCRLGKGQNASLFVEALKKHLVSKLPEGFKMHFKIHQAANSFYTSLNCSSVEKSKKALEKVFNNSAWIGLSGASVPIVSLLAELSKANVSLLGVGLDTDLIHAPNEHFSWDRFEKGFYIILDILNQS